MAAINDVVNDMVKSPAADRHLFYIDSEGDRVGIQSTRDVVEAVRDARLVRAPCIKIYIQSRRSPGTKDGGKGKKCNRPSCGPSWDGWSWASPRHSIYRQRSSHHGKEVVDLINSFGDLFFPGIRLVTYHTTDDTSDQHSDDSTTEANSAQDGVKDADDKGTLTGEPVSFGEVSGASPSTTVNETDQVDEKQMAQTTPIHHEDVAAVDGTNFTFVERENDDVVARGKASSDVNKAKASVAELDSKAAMLKEMGFDIPVDVARNMIEEMGGRMDLIVRALVANNK